MLSIISLGISIISLIISISIYIVITSKEIKEEKNDPYKNYRDPQTGLLKARRVDKV